MDITLPASVGTLAKHIRKGFILDGGFEAVLDGQSKVTVTAVLERTAVYEIPYASWVGRQLARLDRFTIEHPEVLNYREPKARWVVHKEPVKVPKAGRKRDPNQCPGSNQPIEGKHAYVDCSECGQRVFTYPKRGGWCRYRHLRAVGTVNEGTV